MMLLRLYTVSRGKSRYFLTFIIAKFLIISGVVQRAKNKALRGDHILSIYFHKPSLKEFEECVKWLQKNNFKFLSIDELYNIFQKQLPFPSGAVVLTVDDGWLSNKNNIADVAEKYQIPVAIFVSTDPIEQGTYWWSYVEEARKRKLIKVSVKQLKKVPNEERLAILDDLKMKIYLPREAMTIAQIQQIATSKWVTIGAHTLSHPILNNCSADQVYQELWQSKEKLEKWIGKPVDYFAYPNGDYSEREISVLQDQGYKLAFTVHPDYLRPQQLQHRYELPRFEVIENAPFAETICRMMGVWKPVLGRVRRLFAGQTFSMQSRVSPSYGSKKIMST
jgi:peptidoglycan/xylan/chitin deacetylase (PgdA/CDA1 family)